MRTSSVLVITIVMSVIAAVMIYLWVTRPKVSYESIDWLAKTVKYKMSVKGTWMKGTKAYTDKDTTVLHRGNYKMTASAEGNGFILSISKKGKILKGLKIDLTTQEIIKL